MKRLLFLIVKSVILPRFVLSILLNLFKRRVEIFIKNEQVTYLHLYAD